MIVLLSTQALGSRAPGGRGARALAFVVMGWWPVTRLSNDGGGGACMAVGRAGFQGRLCLCKGVCGLQVPRLGHCALFGEWIYCCLGVYVGRLGPWVVMGVTSV